MDEIVLQDEDDMDGDGDVLNIEVANEFVLMILLEAVLAELFELFDPLTLTERKLFRLKSELLCKGNEGGEGLVELKTGDFLLLEFCELLAWDISLHRFKG